MRTVDVVAAIFQRDSQYLACRKKPGLSNAGQWEFPGGKKHSDESAQDALIREIDEELGVRIIVGDSLGTNAHLQEDCTIVLQCFLVADWSGEFVLTDHDRLQWCEISELKMIGLSEADLPFVDLL